MLAFVGLLRHLLHIMAEKICGLASLAAAMLAVAPPAAAEFRVRPAAVEEGEIALENNGSYALARSPQRQGEQSYTAEVEWAPLSWWLFELEGEGGRDPGPDQRNRVTALTGENLFQLVEPGEYWADLGFFAEYGRTLWHQAADAITLGPTISKVWGRSVNTLNFFVVKDVAGHAEGRAAAQPRLADAAHPRSALSRARHRDLQRARRADAL